MAESRMGADTFADYSFDHSVYNAEFYGSVNIYITVGGAEGNESGHTSSGSGGIDGCYVVAEPFVCVREESYKLQGLQVTGYRLKKLQGCWMKK